MRDLVIAEQFAVFLRGGGYCNPANWSRVAPARGGGDEVLRRIGWDWERRHQPVLGLSWFEAEAYARWMGGRLPLVSEARAARDRGGLVVHVAEWCYECYFPGALGPYVRPEPPMRRRVEGWSAGECLVPAMGHKSIGFRVVMGNFDV